MENTVALTQSDMNERAMRLQEAMLAGPTLELEVVHHFGGGIYARQLSIPKGVTVVGEIHRTENMNILLKGEISVTTDEGVKRMIAPAIVTAKPGSKRVGYAHEDSVWLTLHATTEADVNRIRDIFIADSFDALQSPNSGKLIPGGD